VCLVCLKGRHPIVKIKIKTPNEKASDFSV
jgi:hypothetical protein